MKKLKIQHGPSVPSAVPCSRLRTSGVPSSDILSPMRPKPSRVVIALALLLGIVFFYPQKEISSFVPPAFAYGGDSPSDDHPPDNCRPGLPLCRDVVVVAGPGESCEPVECCSDSNQADERRVYCGTDGSSECENGTCPHDEDPDPDPDPPTACIKNGEICISSCCSGYCNPATAVCADPPHTEEDEEDDDPPSCSPACGNCRECENGTCVLEDRCSCQSDPDGWCQGRHTQMQICNNECAGPGGRNACSCSGGFCTVSLTADPSCGGGDNGGDQGGGDSGGGDSGGGDSGGGDSGGGDSGGGDSGGDDDGDDDGDGDPCISIFPPPPDCGGDEGGGDPSGGDPSGGDPREVTQVEVTQVEVTQVEVTQVEVTQVEVTQVEVTQVEVTQVEVTQVEVTVDPHPPPIPARLVKPVLL